MRKFLSIPLIVVFVGTLIFGGCAKPAPAPSPAPAPGKVIELKIGHHTPTASSVHVQFAYFAKEIEERSNGRVKTTIYPADSLFKHKDTLDSIVGGVGDIGMLVYATVAGRFPLSTVTDLPLMPFSDTTACKHVQGKLYEEFPEIREEHANVKVLYWSVVPAAILHLKSRPVHTLEDLSGMKIRCGGTLIPTIEAIGATGVYMAPPDLYIAMEKGVVDGTAFGWVVLGDFKIDELATYHTEVNLGYYGGAVIMNLDSWNSLPADIQDMFNEVAAATGDLADKLTAEGGQKVRANCAERGDDIYILPPQEMARWQENLMPVWEDYVANAEAKGLPGREVLDETLRLGELYSK